MTTVVVVVATGGCTTSGGVGVVVVLANNDVIHCMTVVGTEARSKACAGYGVLKDIQRNSTMLMI
jgi:hypothetical protein